MKQRESTSPRAVFPDAKKNKFQEKFAQLLQGEGLGKDGPLDFAFKPGLMEIEKMSHGTHEASQVDSHEDLEYEQQIRDLKRRVMEKKEKNMRRESQVRDQEEEGMGMRKGSRSNEWDRGFSEHFDPDDLRLSKMKTFNESRGGRERKAYNGREADEPEHTDYYYKEDEHMDPKMQGPSQHRKKRRPEIKESPRPPTGIPPRSECSISEASQTSKRPTVQAHKISSMALSQYKKYMTFSANLKLKKIKFGSRKTGTLKFDIEYSNNFIPARRNHQIKGHEAYIKERFEVPFRAIYDRRKRRFHCENIIVNVMNMYKRYNKRLGQLVVCTSDILNQQQSYFNGKIKLKKTSDRHAEMDIVFSMKLKGVSSKEDFEKNRESYHFDDSYFSYKSEKYVLRGFWNYFFFFVFCT